MMMGIHAHLHIHSGGMWNHLKKQYCSLPSLEDSKYALNLSDFGWENFTDKVIQIISNKKKNIIFLLWGKFAQSKLSIIDSSKHHILVAAHPSPFSAHSGFFGCKHFDCQKYWFYLFPFSTVMCVEKIDWHFPL